jgi:hypothetical protein
LAVAVAVVVWLLRGAAQPGPTTAHGPERSEDGVRSKDGAAEQEGSGDVAPEVERVRSKRRVDEAERRAYRREIAQRLVERHRQRRQVSSADDRSDDDDERRSAPGQIRDRTDGELEDFVATVNDDFMPLAEECYEHALEDAPDLAGMLDMNVSVIADEEIGGLVESAELGAQNEIAHPGMTECIRETMLSTIFPPPDESGRAEVRLTLRFSPDEE